MVNKKYYYVTLKGGIDKIPFRHVNSKIICVKLSDGNLYELITGDRIYKSMSVDIVDLTYESLTALNEKESKEAENILFSLTSEDINEYKKEIFKIKELYSNNYFGLGDKMVKKMMLKSNK